MLTFPGVGMSTGDDGSGSHQTGRKWDHSPGTQTLMVLQCPRHPETLFLYQTACQQVGTGSCPHPLLLRPPLPQQESRKCLQASGEPHQPRFSHSPSRTCKPEEGAGVGEGGPQNLEPMCLQSRLRGFDSGDQGRGVSLDLHIKYLLCTICRKGEDTVIYSLLSSTTNFCQRGKSRVKRTFLSIKRSFPIISHDPNGHTFLQQGGRERKCACVTSHAG